MTLLSRRSHPWEGPRPTGLRVVIGDVRDVRVLAEATRDVAAVVYAVSGGLPGTPSSAPLTEIDLALSPLLAVLEAMRQRSSMRLFFFSSGGAVYGDPPSLPVGEDAPTAPLSPYGVLKVAAEKYIAMYGHLYGISYCILRVGNLYGAAQEVVPGHGAVATILHAAATRSPMQIFGDGHDLRDYVFVDDVAQVLVELVSRSNLPEVLNVGTGEGTSMHHLLATVERVTGRTVQVERLPRRRFDVESIVLDSSRLVALMNWVPTPLEVGVARVWKRLQETAVAPEGHGL